MNQKAFLLLSKNTIIYICICTALIACTYLTGCNSHETLGNDAEKAEVSTHDQESLKKEDSMPQDISNDSAFDPSAILEQYQSKYNASVKFQDVFLHQKYLLINSKEVIQLLLLPNNEQAIVVPIGSISHIKRNTIDNFVDITIYDKTGKTISIYVDQESADEIIKMLS